MKFVLETQKKQRENKLTRVNQESSSKKSFPQKIRHNQRRNSRANFRIQ